MAYNILPKSKKEIQKIRLKPEVEEEVIKLFDATASPSQRAPLALDKSKPTSVKVHRAFKGELDLKKFRFKHIKPTFGNGSRGNRGANNRGNLFEGILASEINMYIEEGTYGKYKQAVIDIINLLPRGAVPIECKEMGGLNQRRTLKVTPSSIRVGEVGDIGHIVTDLDLIYTLGSRTKKMHLSLKLGGTVTLVNAGITKLVPSSEIKNGEIKNGSGKALLAMLGIENERFCNVFNNYTGNSATNKDYVNVKNKIDKRLLNDFMESVIGYGYVLVHKMGNKVHVQNIDKSTMQRFIGIKSAVVEYPLHGTAKRVDLKIEMKGMDVKINLRNKSGKIYPTHLMSDYKLKH